MFCCYYLWLLTKGSFVSLSPLHAHVGVLFLWICSPLRHYPVSISSSLYLGIHKLLFADARYAIQCQLWASTYCQYDVTCLMFIWCNCLLVLFVGTFHLNENVFKSPFLPSRFSLTLMTMMMIMLLMTMMKIMMVTVTHVEVERIKERLFITEMKRMKRGGKCF